MADAMQTQQTQQTPALGEPGEPCQQCGSPLAADQRYCLNCGKRRGGPRVDYRQQMLAAAGTPSSEPPGPVADPEPKQPEKGERDYAPLAAVGGIALLGLMLLVGVLIGKGDGGTATAPVPVVVKGGGEAESSGDEAGAEGKGSGESGPGTSGGGKSKGKRRRRAAAKRPPAKARSRPTRRNSKKSPAKPGKKRRKTR